MARERTDRNGEAAPSQAPEALGLSIAEIRQLISLMNTSDLEELAIEHVADGLKLVLRKPTPLTLGPATVEIEADGMDGAAEDAAPHEKARDKLIEIGAPLVGVFRGSVKPGGKPMVRAGDVVREGQVVGAVEALRMLNEVEATAAGRIKEVFVRDGQAVEYGQPLLAIEPK
ncbi:MAG: acetyl-CoA carboxylase biotin carboxyl carrier protein [Ktedonobacterales bacterium]